MSAQISVEEAFPVYRRRCGELFDETLLLRAQVEMLEAKVARLERENQELQTQVDGYEEEQQ